MLNIFKTATVEVAPVEVAPVMEAAPETTTSKKKSKKAKKAATVETPATETPVIEAPVVETPVSEFASDTRSAILAIVAPTKAKKAATDTAAARKAALAETDKTDRPERVIALMTRPEGASLRDIQTVYWLAAAAVRKLVEKEGYTTFTTGDRGAYRYHAKKA
jgi:hypothetical protein